jgi:POT family proton-dependent oligopeptide transporter
MSVACEDGAVRVRAAGTSWDPPKGAWLIVGIEFWERFSFYGMLGILVLFLTATPARGGFGWSDAEALGLLGVYSACMYGLPMIGGWIADRLIDRRRAVLAGAALLALGHLLMTAPPALPVLIGAWSGLPVAETLTALGAPLGRLSPTPEIERALAAAGASLDAARGPEALAAGYRAAAFGFYAALAALVLGNALMKSSLVVLLGEVFPRDEDARREGAFAYYYLSISVGALLAGLSVGAVAQGFGWHAGFALAALGMGAALASYLVLGPRWLGDVGRARVSAPAREGALVSAMIPAGATVPERATVSVPRDTAALRSTTRRRVLLLLALAAFMCAYEVGWFQLYGSWALFIDRSVDRTIGAVEVPVPWFEALNSAVVIAAAPIFAAWLIRLRAHASRIDIVHKYAAALAAAALGHLLMFAAAAEAGEGARASPWLPVLAIVLLSLGELIAWVSTYGIVYRAAPSGYTAATMGAWYLLTLGAGGWLAGRTGGVLAAGGFARTFLGLAVLLGAAALLALLSRRALHRLAERAAVAL